MNYQSLKDLTVVCGHYGTGKTNFAINLAMGYAGRGQQVTLCDLDIVNPYFRVSDFPEPLREAGVELILPTYGRTNLDLPSLPAEMYSITTRPGRVIVDVGGDDAGATALGRYAAQIESKGYDMLYVINGRRSMSAAPGETAELLREIERASRLKATALVNNTHLMKDTTADTVLSSIAYAGEVSRLTGLPIALTALERKLAAELAGEVDNLFPVDIYVKPNWR